SCNGSQSLLPPLELEECDTSTRRRISVLHQNLTRENVTIGSEQGLHLLAAEVLGQVADVHVGLVGSNATTARSAGIGVAGVGATIVRSTPISIRLTASIPLLRLLLLLGGGVHSSRPSRAPSVPTLVGEL